MRKLRRIKVNKFRDVKPGMEIQFSDGFNLIIGKNGSGKTTLLKLIRLIVSDDLSSLDEEEFDLEWELEMGAFSFQVQTRNTLEKPESEQNTTRKRHQTHSSESSSRYSATILLKVFKTEELQFTCERDARRAAITLPSGFSRTWSVGDEVLIGEPNDLDEFVAYPLFLDLDHEPELQALCPLLEDEIFLSCIDTAVQDVERFDEGDGWWRYLERRFFLASVEADPQGDSLETPEERIIGSRVRQIMATKTPIVFVENEAPPEVEEVLHWMGYHSVSVMASLEDDTDNGEKDRYYSKVRFGCRRRDGRHLWSRQLSWGEQRMLAFSLYLTMFKPDNVLIIDELTNGMHPDMIEYCLAKIKGCQCFLATQSAMLLDYMEFGSVDQLRASFVVCTKEVAGARDLMAWRNLEGEEASELYRDYEVGILRNHSMLRMRGIW